ncbi:hypothetical protein CRT60_01210 [Azospirillum palustre]|uniref:DUF4852 domain-containing protein n=1 Tax=Azospirillum palustre TaxID=2044885 RepID=A0A2B8BMW0_9PROT|nr:DUF4852 domain-containing protein [Azospirillum palustre]PGH59281.1 hypothetical protein CRT60_01210 [Azospirillum palustre]
MTKLMLLNAMAAAALTLAVAVPSVSDAKETAPQTKPAATTAAADKAPAQTETPEKSRTVAFDWESLLGQWLAANPDKRSDKNFADSYTRHFECFGYTQVRNNDFRRDEFLEQGRSKVASLSLTPKTNVVLRTDAEFGKYDFDRREFAFEPLSEGTYFPVDKPQSIRPSKGWDNCFPTDTSALPQRFKVEITNPEVLTGLPMAKDKADALVAQRTNKYNGVINRRVVLSVTLAIDTFGSGEARDGDNLLLNGQAVTVKTHIVATSVEDGKDQSQRVLYTLDPERMTTKMAVAAANRERQQAEEAAIKAERGKAVDVGPSTLDAAFTRLKGGAPVGNEALQRIALKIDACKEEVRSGGGAVPVIHSQIRGLGEEDNVWQPSGNRTGLKFVNLASFDNIALPQEMEGTKPPVCYTDTAEVIFAPVGTDNERRLGGDILMGHVVRIDFPWNSNGKRKVFPFTAKDDGPKPWKRPEDPRTARDLDIIGVKGGMPFEEVKAVAEKELGQTLVWDGHSKRLTSPPEQCTFTELLGSSLTYLGKRPIVKIGQRCFEATFDETDGRRVLVKLALRQVLPAEKAKPISDAITGKYGKPIYATFDRQDPALAFRAYGKRWTEDRLDGRTIPVPQYALEIDGTQARDDKNDPVYILSTYLMDQIVLDRKTEADERLRKEKEEKAKVDVKL